MSFAKLKPWRDHLSFISIHCKSADRNSLPLIPCLQNAKRDLDIYIVGCSLVPFAILACFGNIPAIDAFFFAVSSCTESGLNTIDVKDLKLGQQLVIYIFPKHRDTSQFNFPFSPPPESTTTIIISV